MTTDLRALLEEACNGLLAYSVLHPEHDTELVERIRGALAQAAVTEQPSDDDLYDLADQYAGEPVAAIRAALARWGRPAPPAEGEVAELASYLNQQAEGQDGCGWHYDAAILRRAADLLERGRPAPAPIPVAERRPGPEDCDAGELAWLLAPYWITSRYDITHWLPADALPLPGSTTTTTETTNDQ